MSRARAASRRAFTRAAALALFTFFAGPATAGPAPVTIRLWHSFRDREQKALRTVVTAFNLEETTARIEEMSLSSDGFTDRLERSIASGSGPDLFIWAHDKTGEWAQRGFLAALDETVDTADYLPNCLDALRWRGRILGLPLSFETLILYYNRALFEEKEIERPPVSTDEMIEIAKSLSAPERDRYGLIYDRANFYYHSIWLHGFGGRVCDDAGRFALDSPEMVRSIEFARDLASLHRVIPDTVDWRRQMEYFNSGRAAMLVSGHWAYGDIAETIPLGMALLPSVSATNTWAAPYLGVKAVFVNARSAHRAAAFRAAAFITSGYGSSVMNILAAYLPANRRAYENGVVAGDTVTSWFKEQVLNSVPMPSHPAMKHVWKLMMTDAATHRHGCLDRVFLDRADPRAVLGRAQAEFERAAGAPRGAGGARP